ncbi:MAG: 3-deoxy-D-manno-octulosonic acid transferase [Limnohabitans sp.]
MPQPVQPVMSWAERLSLAAYGLLMRGLQPLLRRKLQRRGQQEPGYLHQVPQRFGLYDTAALAPGCVWVHAVSLGETRAAGLLIDALRARLPGMRLLLTHSTATGWAQGQSLLQPGDVQAWLPWDTPEATRRFLQHHQPRCGILMETEVWPSLVQTCQQQAVPLYLVNARLNDKSLRSAKRWAWLSGPAYRGLTGVLAQSDADAQGLSALGARVDAVLGNLKFDVKPQPQAQAGAQQWRAQWTRQGQSRPVIMLASTREGEEALWLNALASNAWRAQAFADAGVLWLLVPRHPQRFDEVHQLVQGRGWSIFRRSALPAEGQAWPIEASAVQVWLGDSLGEMPQYFHAADMALLGGSFMPLGGQNLIEAAAFGCPIVMGPHTFNFAEASAQAEAAGAAQRVADMDGALDQALAWLNDRAALARAQQAGLDMVAQGRGAAERYAQALVMALNAV